MNEIQLSKHTVLCQNWDESDPVDDWGIRPDGWSLHLSEEGRKQYVDEYWKGMPDSTPDEYSRPSGEARWVYVTQEVYDAIKSNGLRIWRHQATMRTMKTGERYLKIKEEYKANFQPAADNAPAEEVPKFYDPFEL